jgi:hypothetical protein
MRSTVPARRAPSAPTSTPPSGAPVADGLGADTIAGIVELQTLHPGMGSRMPAGLATGDDAENVAAYVAHAAAVPGEDQGGLGEVD